MVLNHTENIKKDQELKKNNKKDQELKKSYGNPNFKSDKQRREFLEKTIGDMQSTRYVGSTAVKLIIAEDKNKENDGSSNEQLSSFESRERTQNKTICMEWHSLPFDEKVSNIEEIDGIVATQVNKLVEKVFNRPYVIDVNVDKIQNQFMNIQIWKWLISV